MKHLNFILKSIGLAVSIGALMIYNLAATNRDKLVKAYEAQVAEIEAYNAQILGTDSSNGYSDGVFEGTGRGWKSDITVRVAISGGLITDIEVVSQHDDEPYVSNAINKVPEIIKRYQSTDIVDVASGVTLNVSNNNSPKGILAAVNDALEKAKNSNGNSPFGDNDIQPSVDYADGTYIVYAYGETGSLKVSVEILDGSIENITISEWTDDDQKVFRVRESVVNEILFTQSTDVDVASGAEFTSYGVINAVKKALTMASVAGNMPLANYEDGQHHGIGIGRNGQIKVMVTVSNGFISDIQLEECVDDPPYIYMANDMVTELIKFKQSPDVDVASGATISSHGIIDAVKDALSKPADNTIDISSGYADGTYEVSALSQNDSISVNVTISGGLISKIEPAIDFDDPSIARVIDSIIESQSTDRDVNPTEFNANAIRNAVKKALVRASSPGMAVPSPSFADESRGGHARGYRGDISVDVSVSGNFITDISVTLSSDDEPHISMAKDTVIELIKLKQSTDVDVASGATISSRGIIDAVKNALSEEG